MAPNRYYTTFDIVKIIDIKMQRLQDWIKRGFIKPSHEEQVGRGIKKYFDRTDLYIIQLFKHLVENGITREEALSWTSNVKEAIKMDQLSLKIQLENREDSSQRLIDWTKKMPNFIAFFKGGSPIFEGVRDPDEYTTTYVDKREECTLTFKTSSQMDTAHIINFSKIVKEVDCRLD